MGTGRNLVLVLAHGLRSDALGDSRAWPLTTPNLLKLAGRSLRAVAVSACPADPGGMVSVLTGLHARQHGILEQAPRHMRASGGGGGVGAVAAGACEGWPAWLRAAGYHLAGVGCVAPIEPWLHEAVFVEDVDVQESSACAYLHALENKGMKWAVQQQRRQRLRAGLFAPDRLLIEPDDDIDGFIFVQARRMLARMPADRPWALIIMLSGPANDLPPPTIYSQIVSPESVGAGFQPIDLRVVNGLAELDYPRVMLQRLATEQIGRIRADYLGRVGLVDYGVGRLATAMAARADYQRCWLMLSSDRGHLLGEHGLVGHRSFLAGAVEVPVLLVPPAPGAPGIPGIPGFPGFHAPRPTDGDDQAPPIEGLVSTVDVAATIAGLSGCDMPRPVTGQSVLSLLDADQAFGGLDALGALGVVGAVRRSSCLSEFNRRLMFQTATHKVIFNTETRSVIGLYDLLTDADEQKNLAGTPPGMNLLDALRWRLGDCLMPLYCLPRNGR
jgi:arylsulfatase A-like enzyme